MKKLVVFVFFSLFMLFSTQSVEATSWYYVGAASNSETFFIDNSSVRKNANWAQVWAKINHTDGSYSIMLLRINRPSRMMAVISSIDYDSYGNVLRSNSYPSSPTSIIPGSMGEGVLELIW
ncbi:surface-adhesin E family protein [uncultured Veillonella sp.]|uniref:surface-adhesin E family protein n=1 Tax=uncultured Veillonella sp. TaxID=159268 RepID=UPI0025CD29E3|nr:surface-adhesin E family protein [uncultured Veillonella sp.]